MEPTVNGRTYLDMLQNWLMPQIAPLPANLQELRDRITAAVTLLNRDMLTRVWN
ncbi:hypothetical protein C0J52_06467 [Blattella germanica]|nr:hypothetical protein C0J52_06467 [Blattella germanica]